MKWIIIIWTAEMKWNEGMIVAVKRNLCNCVKTPVAPNVSGFIAQLVEHGTGIASSRVQTPLKSWIFFRLLYATIIPSFHNNNLSCHGSARMSSSNLIKINAILEEYANDLYGPLYELGMVPTINKGGYIE